MSLRLKVILGILTIIAGFLVVRVLMLFGHNIETAKTEANILSAADPAFANDNPLTKDTDHDGLPDRDEIIYGSDPFNPDTDGDDYKDGEEIQSNHDPLDSSSNDKTGTSGISSLSPTANLTDRLLNLGIAGLINNAGNLDPEQMTDHKYAAIMADISNSAELILAGPPLTDEAILISDNNDPQTIKKYINTVTATVEEGLFSTSAKNIGGSIDDLLGLANDKDYYLNKYNALKAISTPPSWKEIHKSALTNLYVLANATKALDDKTIEEDPIKASFAASKLQESFLALNELLSRATNLAHTQKIPIQDSILDALHSANQPTTTP